MKLRLRAGCNSETHPLTEDQFVNVSSKHRTSREDAAVRRRHHRRRYRSQPEEGNKIRCQILQDQRQNHAGLRLRERIRTSIPRLVPSCNIIITQLTITQLKLIHGLLINVCLCRLIKFPHYRSPSSLFFIQYFIHAHVIVI